MVEGKCATVAAAPCSVDRKAIAARTVSISVDDVGSTAQTTNVEGLRARSIAICGSLYQLSQEASDVALLEATYDEVENAISADDFLLLNFVLDSIQTEYVRTIALTAIARSTFRVRSKVPMWPYFVAEIWGKIKGEGRNANHALRGLITDDSKFSRAKRSLS
ncbi:MAG: hypothetical protein Q7T69_08175 [Rhodoferax sp.]|nr:hypothetical protein [Rhodoferax sp.]